MTTAVRVEDAPMANDARGARTDRSSKRAWIAPTAVALLALASSVTSIGHDFTYDDRAMVFDNPAVHTLLHVPKLFAETYWPPQYGGDGYRPLVTTLFALQWTAANGAPWLFHLVNILLAIATAVAVWWCASAILPPLGALVTGALFAVHPVHVEVTGNVVGQSELLVALFLCLAIGLYLRRRGQGALRERDVFSLAALFAFALLAKEHAVVLPPILVAAELTVTGKGGWRERLRETRLLWLSLVAVGLAYFYVRGFIQSDLAGFIPFPVFRFLNMRPIDRIGTMMNEMPRIAQLLVFPSHLSADYSPADVIVAKGFDVTQIPGIFLLFATVLLAIVLRKRAPVASFGLMWLIVAFLPVSNLLVPAGFITAERTLFFPSVGVMLVAGAIAEHVRTTATPSRLRLATAALALLLVAGLARSVVRQRVWKNNGTLVASLVADAPLGYRAHFVRGRHLSTSGRFREMDMEYKKAIRLFPYDAAMTLAVADAYTRAGFYGPAADLFEWSYQVAPSIGEGRYEYIYCLARLRRWQDLRREALAGLAIAPYDDARRLRGALHEAHPMFAPRADTALRNRASAVPARSAVKRDVTPQQGTRNVLGMPQNPAAKKVAAPDA